MPAKPTRVTERDAISVAKRAASQGSRVFKRRIKNAAAKTPPLYRPVDWFTLAVTTLVIFVGYMLTLSPAVRIYLATGATDLRRSIDGLPIPLVSSPSRLRFAMATAWRRKPRGLLG